MIVILVNFRTFYYKAVPTNDDPFKPYKIRWEIVRQITDYPGELENDEFRLEFFTPNFSRYLILDKKELLFKIKDTESDTVLFTVPRDLMTYEKD